MEYIVLNKDINGKFGLLINLKGTGAAIYNSLEEAVEQASTLKGKTVILNEDLEIQEIPTVDAEDCICKEEMEESGIEYTPDFSIDCGHWKCDHCGRIQ
jgi:hypothetical protein